MKLTLNPYTLVINANGIYNLFLGDHNNAVKIAPNHIQLQVLDSLNSGSFYEYQDLCSVFGKTAVDALLSQGCLMPGKIDTESMFSRTNAFFLTHNMPEARMRISSKKVLILGCGGIGTHMAWHMATLGVNQITLVDFDDVEISNFNRQLLFDRSDAGKVKAEVLREKLHAINPDVKIGTIFRKISSERELEAICLTDNYDLIIKALDSPAEFPLWLDNVARRHNLTYIAGITMRENVLVGPTFIPGKSTYGWSDLMGLSAKSAAQKVYGTAPSLGIMLYHISDELAIEAFKILSGYGSPKYTDRILSRNVITDEEKYIQKGKGTAKPSDSKGTTGTALALNFMLMAVMALAGIKMGWFIPLSLIMAMATPFILFKGNRDVIRCTFINSTIVAVGILIRMISTVDTSSVTALVSSVVILFGVHSAVTLFTCVMNYFIHKAFCKQED